MSRYRTRPRKKRRRYILPRVVLAFLLFCALFWLATAVLKPKWLGQDTGVEPATRMMEGFYLEPRDSLDVLFLGSSNMYCSVSPLTLWEETGVTSYVRGSSVQRMWISYYYLEEALRTQSPKVVVLDMLGLQYSDRNTENRNRKTLDYMKPSLIKLQAVLHSPRGDGTEDLPSYFFPLLRYHSRWQTLTATDFTYLFSDKHDWAKGYFTQYAVNPCGGFALRPATDDKPPSEEVLEYLDKLVRLCNKNGIELVFLKTPSIVWTQEDHDRTAKLAEQYGVPFLDYNTPAWNPGVDPQTDVLDGGYHLNDAGAKKFTQKLGVWLTGRYALPGRRRDAALAQRWDADLAYQKKLEAWAAAPGGY